MKKSLLLFALGVGLVAVLAVRLYREGSPPQHTLPAIAPVQSVLSQRTNLPPEEFLEVYPAPLLPPPPVVLPKREPGRKLDPTREEVQAVMARMRRGPEQEPEYSKLHAQLMGVDFRDYPEEFAEIVGGPGYFSYIWTDRKREFHANDDPGFLQSVVTYFNREQPRLSPPSRYFDFIEFFQHMTNSPALVPPLIKGLESLDFRAVSASARSLSFLPTPESARALVEHAKRQGPRPPNVPEDTAVTNAHQEIGRLRNLELVPYLEKEMAAAKDESLRLHLKFAIVATQDGVPALPSEETWKATWKKVEGLK